MNVIGIDHQAALTTVCLREGDARHVPTRLVGDGRHRMFHHAGTEHGSASAVNGAFWQTLHQRVYAHVGCIRPTRRNGFRTVIASDSEQDAAAARQSLRTAGFDEIDSLGAADALLCRFLAFEGVARSSQVVAVAAVGDRWVHPAAYRVSCAGSGAYRIERRSVLPRSEGGHSYWTGQVLDRIRRRLHEPPQQPQAFGDAVLEFGARLRSATFDEEVGWIGPASGRMSEPLTLNRRECSAWLEAAHLAALPGKLGEAVRGLGAPRADRVVVGGVGAVWPMAADALAPLGPVWQSDRPEEDIACGAAWWPSVVSRESAEEARGGPASLRVANETKDPPSRMSAAATDDAGFGSAGDDVAPWRRRKPLS